ncbi:hypothetical protein PF011_g31253 [Phytophthora fragariae]|uniref:Cyclic nucleotide-binding domain-containing protein n=1 Tax=Phytophthora fragariae TaxID=53985 RepID=A0A6A3GI26_9STRA|nr:hypothetical protein PF011_g31253 [Phytophthora fragariae]
MTRLLEVIVTPAHKTLISARDDEDEMFIFHSGVLTVVPMS